MSTSMRMAITWSPRARAAALAAIGSLLALSTSPFANAQAVASADSGAGTEALQTVVVTARRRVENLQDVPLAVTAIGAATLAERDIINLEDLNSFVPNMKIANDRATSSTINVFIRGVGQNDPLWGFEPGVGVYVDDVYLARPQGALLDVLDVDRLEVLRGPQGTLYGKNTIAGAIKYVTRDIAGPAHLDATVSFGNYGERDERLSASTPVIADHVYFGIAIGDFHHDGYGQVLGQSGTTPSPYNHFGEGVSTKDILAARANLTITWGASSKLKIIADTTQDNSSASGGQRLDAFLAPPLADPFDTRTDMPVNRDFFYRNGLAATYTQGLTEQLDLKLVGAYIQGNGQQFIDFDELNLNLLQVPGHYKDQQSSGEGQLTFTNDLVKAVGGLFFMDNTACGAYDESLGDLDFTAMVNGCVNTKSSAVYADTSWKLTPQLNLDAGLRWNQDRKSATIFQGDWLGVLAPNQSFDAPAGAPPGFFFLGAVTDYTNRRTFPNLSPRLGLDYHLTPQVMTYFSYSRGFKSGGFDMRGNAALYPQTENGYNSETADNFEFGVKSTLLDETLLLNLTLFYDPYKDAQIGLQEFIGLQNLTAVLNAGKQINQGVELESVWHPVRAFNLGLNIGYLDSYYENVAGCIAGTPGCSNPPPNAAYLYRPINAPTWTLSGNAAYSWFLARGELTARLGEDWRSFTKVANAGPSVTDQPAYGLLNAGLAFTTVDKAWRLSLDGKNLTNRYYRVAGYDFGPPPPTALNPIGGESQIGFDGPPRTYGVTLSYRY